MRKGWGKVNPCRGVRRNKERASYELREAAATAKKSPEIKFSRRLVEFRSRRSSL
jgi:hypothetical protein